MDSATQLWWTLLCAVSALNVLGWALAVAALRRRQGLLQPATLRAMKLQVLLSAGYVLGCGYRCLFPVFDVRRLCLVDSFLSSVVVGRSVATVAELCFAAQWALLVRGASLSAGSPWGQAASRAVLPMIAVAEVCSWTAVLTTANLGHVLEETLWGLAAVLVVISVLQLLPRARAQARPALLALGLLGVGYVVYMFGVDVPMYWARWSQDLAEQRAFLDIAQGLADTSTRWVVSHRWEDWQSEVVWMSAYFSVGVWLSIALIHAPHLFNAPASRAAR